MLTELRNFQNNDHFSLKNELIVPMRLISFCMIRLEGDRWMNTALIEIIYLGSIFIYIHVRIYVKMNVFMYLYMYVHVYVCMCK